MDNYNIFIVASPLQLLNCIEAAHHFQTVNNILLIVKTSNQKNLTQMKNLLKIYSWDEVRYISLPTKHMDRIVFTKTIQKTMQDLIPKGIQRIFVGEYRSDNIINIVNNINASEVYLVDDGLALINYNSHIEKKSYREKIRNSIYKLFSYNLDPIQYKFFTIFHLPKKQIITNQYQYIKQFNKNKVLEDCVYFIGQPLVELSIIKENEYIKELRKVLNYYKNKKFVYISHRLQKEISIKKLSSELGFEYKIFDQLIEVELLNATIMPSDFATFYSTAIVTLPQLFDNSTYKSFQISTKKLNKQHVNINEIEECYLEFKTKNIDVIQL